MTQRFFYTDPLAAAWMARHHGMRFLNTNNDEEVGLLEILAHAATTNFCHLHIHPESLKLLEPQDGDLVVTETWGYLQTYDERIKVPIKVVMQRGGVFFMWPERETS